MAYHTRDNEGMNPLIFDRIRALSVAKRRAVAAEDYKEAKRCKGVIQFLRQTGSALRDLELAKVSAVDNEDFDRADALKDLIAELWNVFFSSKETGVLVDASKPEEASAKPSSLQATPPRGKESLPPGVSPRSRNSVGGEELTEVGISPSRRRSAHVPSDGFSAVDGDSHKQQSKVIEEAASQVHAFDEIVPPPKATPRPRPPSVSQGFASPRQSLPSNDAVSATPRVRSLAPLRPFVPHDVADEREHLALPAARVSRPSQGAKVVTSSQHVDSGLASRRVSVARAFAEAPEHAGHSISSDRDGLKENGPESALLSPAVPSRPSIGAKATEQLPTEGLNSAHLASKAPPRDARSPPLPSARGVYDLEGSEPTAEAGPNKSKAGATKPSYQYQRGSVEDELDLDEAREPCPHCGRTFSVEAIQRHINICQRSTNKKGKRIGADTGATKSEVDAKVKLNNNWKAKSEQFREAMRNARLVAQYQKEGRLNELPAMTTTAPDDRIACPHCSRKFGAVQAERHIPICARRVKR
eukprot:TRINITY_DN26123_c0_g1_i1.p1 TRINITY_DN26123_c0_g1~~TRINITY_DN26123_c0_g1_i1.p1  ORF type:complete len:564 (-),score=53.95 TRINITY_DN26123_c0_g1_i1:71-1654(-)